MSKTTYTIRGSKTTTAIEYAPHSVQRLWLHSTKRGINVLRVRAIKERTERTQGNTFFGFHKAKVSAYQQLEDAIFPLYFKRKVKLGESNKGMQVLEVADNFDVEETMRVVDDYEKYVDSSWNRFTVRLKETLFYNVSLFQR